MSESYSVLGMTCGGCAASVTNAIMDAKSDATVSIDLDAKTVTVDGIEALILKQVIEDAGFEFAGVA